jgi:flagellar basal-body rod protein FlgG
VIQACLLDLAVISENLKNIGTCGYKRLNYRPRVQIGNAGAITPSTSGEGSAPERSFANLPQRDFSEGELLRTAEMLDLAIAGEGFFEVEMPDGTSAYSRDGQFSIGGEGKVLNSSGYALRSGFQPIPRGTTNIQISPKGQVDCFSEDGIGSFQIQLCRFTNPGGLQLKSPNLFLATESSGPPEVFLPGENHPCEPVPGYLEDSNANLEAGLLELIQIIRAFEIYSPGKKTSEGQAPTPKEG